MLWYFFLLLALSGIILGIVGLYSTDDIDVQDLSGVFALFCFVAFIIVLGVAIVGSANLIGKSRSAASNETLVLQVSEQRDHLLSVVEDDLSPEAYTEILSGATDVSDITVILGTDASTILVNRVNEIIQLNDRVYQLQNQKLQDQRYVCDSAGNPFYPRLPFVSADCNLDIDY